MGGTVHPINSAVDASHGIATWDWPEPDEVDGEMSLKYTVSMAYIEMVFQMETWQQEFDLKSWKRFHIPRDGAVSINLNNLTTMPWSEELRVEKEIFEESLIMAEPPTKKRETARGKAVTSARVWKESLHTGKESEPPILSQAKKQPTRIRRLRASIKQQPRKTERVKKRNAGKDMRNTPSGRLAKGTRQPGRDGEPRKRGPDRKPVLEVGENTKDPVVEKAAGPATQPKIPRAHLKATIPVVEQSSVVVGLEDKLSAAMVEEQSIITKVPTKPEQKARVLATANLQGQ